MRNYKIMIVDDENDILHLLEKALEIEGFVHIKKANTGLMAIAMCKNVNPDVLVLDVMLPDIDGYEVCKQIRQFSQCPIIFLSSKNDEVDKILGLAVGGDDYITKPFSPREIAYRVKAQLRRLEYRKSPMRPQLLEVGALRIQVEACRVTKNNVELGLTAREFGILLALAENVGCVISRERLYEMVWGEDGYGSDTIMVHIRHLREKIEDIPAKPIYIVTAKGLGYKLVNPHEK